MPGSPLRSRPKRPAPQAQEEKAPVPSISLPSASTTNANSALYSSCTPAWSSPSSNRSSLARVARGIPRGSIISSTRQNATIRSQSRSPDPMGQLCALYLPDRRKANKKFKLETPNESVATPQPQISLLPTGVPARVPSCDGFLAPGNLELGVVESQRWARDGMVS
jgi:hypothetical protein